MLILAILTLLNLTGFFIMGYDKRNSIKGKSRVPEKTLLFTAFLGGAAGIYIGMKCFRHKTLHWKFSIGVPLMLLLHVYLLQYLDQ